MNWLSFLILILLTAQVHAADLPVTSPFGWRFHPISGDWQFHSGVDLGYELNTPIGSLFDGQVLIADDLGDGYGLQVLIFHPLRDAFTRYAHCSHLFVVQGQTVRAGQIISLVGSTGISTGPHLHLEFIIKVNGVYTFSDPLTLWQ